MDFNCTGKYCKCYEAGFYYPEEGQPSSSLLIVAYVHIYFVVILGTIGNGVAIWCVATCKKTRPAVKVLLYSVFVPLLVICLVTRPMRAELILTLLNCDPERTSYTFRMITELFYSCLAQMELACITVLAIVRTVAVWSSQRHTLKLRVAVTIVISVFIYSLISGVGMLAPLWMGYVRAEKVKEALIIIYFFVNVMLPFFITALAYALMLYAMRQNRQRLAVSASRTTNADTLDQATRAMLAVFISNLVFGFPHALHHILVTSSHTLAHAFHILFYTHFVVDPLVFIWYNNNYRQNVRERMYAGWAMTVGCCKSPTTNESLRKISSVLPLWTSSLSVDQKSSSSGDPRGTVLAGTGLTQV